MKITIYPLSSPDIGLGHLMRCISIALELQKIGGEVAFLCADDNAIDILHNIGFCIVDTIESTDALLLDGYDFTAKQMLSFSKKTAVYFFDDINAFQYPVHTVINYNIYAADFYSNSSQTAHMLLGTTFTPLRAEFCDAPPLFIKQEIENIFVSVGGSDTLSISQPLTSAICENFPRCTVHLVVGTFSNVFDTKHKNLVFHKNVTEMARLMRRCDVAVSAAGSTLYELCASGVPTVSFYYADNQMPGALSFQQKNIIKTAGDYRENAKKAVENIIDSLVLLSQNSILRAEQSFKMQKVVDGKGAQRIAQIICKTGS